MKEKQRAHFNSIASFYISSRDGDNKKCLDEAMWGAFFEECAAHLNGIDKVLEPMCGVADGYFILRRGLGRVFDYHGFDYSEEMVKHARERNPGISLSQADATTFTSDGKLYDLILLIGGLHHVYNHAEDVINNLKSTIRTGGFFISFEPTHSNPIQYLIRHIVYSRNKIFDRDNEAGFQSEALDKYFANASFVKVAQFYPGLLSYILYYNPDAFPFLNLGGPKLVELIFTLDKIIWKSPIGRALSFATLTLWKRVK